MKYKISRCSEKETNTWESVIVDDVSVAKQLKQELLQKGYCVEIEYINEMKEKCKECYFNENNECKLYKRLGQVIDESKECDYFQDKKFVFNQVFEVALEQPRMKKMLENPDLKIKFEHFIEADKDIINDKDFNDKINKLKESANEMFGGFGIFENKKLKELVTLKELLLLEVREIGGKYYIKYRNLEEDNYIDYEISEDLYEALK